MADTWAKIHASYQNQDWIDKPSLFAHTVATYLPANASILELGAGQGQDGRYFAKMGHRVISTDLTASALELARSKTPETLVKQIEYQLLDLSKPFPADLELFSVIYAHLSLHYFDSKTTERIFDDIYRHLEPGGLLAFLCNSSSDPEYNTGPQLEPDYFTIDGINKRFFTVDSARTFIKKFNAIILDNNGETYKDRAKNVHDLIRFIGAKHA